MRRFYDEHMPSSSNSAVWRPHPPGLRRGIGTSYYSPKSWDECPSASKDPFSFKHNCAPTNETSCRLRIGDRQRAAGKRQKHLASSNMHGGTRLSPKSLANLSANRSWTASGEPVGEVIERTLREAWGPLPPRVDLIVRAGCGAADELQLLYPTLELFWPSFLGDVILVLDAGDDALLDMLTPPNAHAPSSSAAGSRPTTKLSSRTVYERLPCNSDVTKPTNLTVPARIFNQANSKWPPSLIPLLLDPSIA